MLITYCCCFWKSPVKIFWNKLKVEISSSSFFIISNQKQDNLTNFSSWYTIYINIKIAWVEKDHAEGPFYKPYKACRPSNKKNDFTKYRRCVINHYKHKCWGDWPHLKGSGHTPLGHDLAPLITLSVLLVMALKNMPLKRTAIYNLLVRN